MYLSAKKFQNMYKLPQSILSVSFHSNLTDMTDFHYYEEWGC